MCGVLCFVIELLTSFQFCSDLTCLVCQRRRSFQGKFQVNLLNDDTYRWNCVTSSVRCALNMEILDLLNERAFLERTVVELVYKFDEKSYCECLKR